MNVFYLTIEEALAIAEAATGAQVDVRDAGLLEAALARPRTTVFGEDAYPTVPLKAAAMLQSMVKNHPLVDGNKRLGFACTAVFLHVNGLPPDLTQDEAYDLIIDVASGELDEVEAITERLGVAAQPRLNLVERMSGHSGMDEDEAMDLAVEAQHKTRTKRPE